MRNCVISVNVTERITHCQPMMKFNLPVRLPLSENSITVGIFVATFALGLLVLSLSASILVSAAFMAVTSAGFYMAAKYRADGPQSMLSPTDTKTVAAIEVVERKIARIEQAIDQINAPGPEETASLIRQTIEPIESLLREVASMTLEHDRKLAERTPDAQSTAVAPPQPIASTPPANAVPHPILKIKMETMLREDLLEGRMKLEFSEIVDFLTGRPAYRQVNGVLAGRSPQLVTERDLAHAGIAPALIRLFDRIRFGHAFNLAEQGLALRSGPGIICPLTTETWIDLQSASEIADLMERRPGIAQRFCLIVPDSAPTSTNETTDRILLRLKLAGCGLAIAARQDLVLDPLRMSESGVRLVLVPAALLIAADRGKVESEIHPADLTRLLDRYGIELAAIEVANDEERRLLKPLGVRLIAGNGSTPANPLAAPPETANNSDTPSGAHEITAAIGGSSQITSISSLKARLRRIEA